MPDAGPPTYLEGLEASEAPAHLLRRDLLDARARTLDLVADVSDADLMGPRLAIVNPMRWEIGHLGWFQEKWVLRVLNGRPPVRADADRLYDSMAVAHGTRWDLPLPSRADTLAYLEAVLARVLALVAADPVDPRLAYFCRLVTFHEDMHDEAFTYTRQTLGLPPPRLRDRAPAAAAPPPPPAGDVSFTGGGFLPGAEPGALPFVFDNEKWAHPVTVAPFALARTPVLNREFAAFVEDGGYRRPELWTGEGRAWREDAGAEHPVYWRRSGGGWERRVFDRWEPLPGDHPVIHVNLHEAEAYCRWAGRRLPTEAEWEFAAAGPEKRLHPWGADPPGPDRANLDALRGGTTPAGALPAGDTPEGLRQMCGNVWEWTATPFGPYPGFVPDPYADYSRPWMDGRHQVLRGGAWTTRGRLLRNTWRNFYPRHRRDVLAGFRTCAR